MEGVRRLQGVATSNTLESTATERMTPAEDFEEFVHATADRLYRSALLLCGDHHLAEDLTQTTYAKVYVNWRKVPPADSPLAYTRTILTRTFLSHRRLRRRRAARGRAARQAESRARHGPAAGPARRAGLLPPATGRCWCCATGRTSPSPRPPSCSAFGSPPAAPAPPARWPGSVPTFPTWRPDMLLHDQMNDAVADVHMDPERLDQRRALPGRTDPPAPPPRDDDRRGRGRRDPRGRAGRRGSGGRPRSFQDPGRERPERIPPSPSTGDGPPVQIDGRSTVAALRAAVLEVADGDTTAYAGQSGFPIGETERRVGEDPAALEDTYGEFELTPASGGGPGMVGVNVQHASVLEGFPFNCTYEWMIDCEHPPAPGRRPGAHLQRTCRCRRPRATGCG